MSQSSGRVTTIELIKLFFWIIVGVASMCFIGALMLSSGMVISFIVFVQVTNFGYSITIASSLALILGIATTILTVRSTFRSRWIDRLATFLDSKGVVF